MNGNSSYSLVFFSLYLLPVGPLCYQCSIQKLKSVTRKRVPCGNKNDVLFFVQAQGHDLLLVEMPQVKVTTYCLWDLLVLFMGPTILSQV